VRIGDSEVVRAALEMNIKRKGGRGRLKKRLLDKIEENDMKIAGGIKER
jgi:hypothetical protein